MSVIVGGAVNVVAGEPPHHRHPSEHTTCIKKITYSKRITSPTAPLRNIHSKQDKIRYTFLGNRNSADSVIISIAA